MHTLRRGLIGVASGLAIMSCAASSWAQDVVVEDDVPATAASEPDVIVEDDVRVVDRPAVYGWSALRPADCGTFHYWNGERCVDARTEPPVP
jgi:hypothetical protein